MRYDGRCVTWNWGVWIDEAVNEPEMEVEGEGRGESSGRCWSVAKSIAGWCGRAVGVGSAAMEKWGIEMEVKDAAGVGVRAASCATGRATERGGSGGRIPLTVSGSTNPDEQSKGQLS